MADSTRAKTVWNRVLRSSPVAASSTARIQKVPATRRVEANKRGIVCISFCSMGGNRAADGDVFKQQHDGEDAEADQRQPAELINEGEHVGVQQQ